MLYGEAHLTPPGANHFGSKEQNAERNRRIHGEDRRVCISESRNRERDAVGQGKSADRFQKHPSVLDDGKQAEHE